MTEEYKNERMVYLRARYDEESDTPIVAMQRRMLDELLPAIVSADSAIFCEWGSSDDLAGTLLDLLMLPYYHREDCQYEWVAISDRDAEKCPHEDAYGVVRSSGAGVKNHCPDRRKVWPNPLACTTCERCTWNQGPDCGKADHPHCPTCGHCDMRHVRAVADGVTP